MRENERQNVRSIYGNTGEMTTTQTATTWESFARQNPALDFEVAKVPMLNSITLEPTPDDFGLYRTDNNELLCIVKNGYSVTQPQKMFDSMNTLVGGKIGFENCGSFNGGRKIFAQIAINEFDLLSSGDTFKGYLTGINSFDKTAREHYKNTMIRIWCRNTFEQAIRDKNGWAVSYKHTGRADARRDEAFKMLADAQQGQLTLQERMEFLATRAITSEQVSATLVHLFEVSDEVVSGEKELSTDKAKRIMTVQGLYEDNDGDTFKQWRGTGYNLIQAIDEYADHHRESRTNNYASIFNTGGQLKQRGVDFVMELLKDAPTINQPVGYSFATRQDLVAELLN